MLVTDGAPTCPDGKGTETTPSDIEATHTAIDALRDQHVRTYVIGYDTTGPGNEMLESVLDGFATRGGTGDHKHRPVEDEASLLNEFQKIASAITKPMTWLREIAEAKTPTATQAPESSSEPR